MSFTPVDTAALQEAAALQETLRVAMVAGELRQGGAEKQLVYMARALRQVGVRVQIYSLTCDEPYTGLLTRMGMPPAWFGQHASPLARLASLVRLLAPFRPHIIQSTHFYTNIYASLAAVILRRSGPKRSDSKRSDALGAAHIVAPISIGSIRSDPERALQGSRAGRITARWQLRAPDILLANSYAAQKRLVQHGLDPRKIFVLPNAIDLQEFDCLSGSAAAAGRAACGHPAWDASSLASEETISEATMPGGVIAITVSRLIQVKRLDIFLRALALARSQAPYLRGIIVGDGPERAALHELAGNLGLLPKRSDPKRSDAAGAAEGVFFLGHRQDVPALLSKADILALTSDYEGFPNVVLEAMAARLPVVATPAGDVPRIVQDGRSGYVVEHGDVEGLAQRLVYLAGHPEQRRQMGRAGREQVETACQLAGLAPRLLDLYAAIARQHGAVGLFRSVSRLQQ